MNASGNTPVSVTVKSDLFVLKNAVKCYYSLKTVKPNIDQTQVAKSDMLKLKCIDPNCEVYYALYYNPYGSKRSDYNWTPPNSIFNMKTDSCVLIGDEYWAHLGGSGTYEEILKIFKSLREKCQELLEGY